MMFSAEDTSARDSIARARWLGWGGSLAFWILASSVHCVAAPPAERATNDFVFKYDVWLTIGTGAEIRERFPAITTEGRK